MARQLADGLGCCKCYSLRGRISEGWPDRRRKIVGLDGSTYEETPTTPDFRPDSSPTRIPSPLPVAWNARPRSVLTYFRRYGGIDILVNAADDPRVDVPFLQITEEIMNASWDTGVMGSLRFIQACYPHMVERGDAAIVNVASGSGLLALAGQGAYSAAQEAIRSLTRTAAVELGPHGVRVNVICPVATGSESLDKWIAHDPGRVAAYCANTPLRRFGDPVADVGEGVVFLCGPQSRYVTGTTLMLDGGRTYLR